MFPIYQDKEKTLIKSAFAGILKNHKKTLKNR